MYNLEYGYYKLLQIFVSKVLCTCIILGRLFLLLIVIFPSLKFELFFIVSPPHPVVLQPNADHGLHILEVSRSHTMMHHSR